MTLYYIELMLDEEILRKATIRDRGSNNDILALVKYILGC
jgi:hypothetical protein